MVTDVWLSILIFTVLDTIYYVQLVDELCLSKLMTNYASE